MKSTPTTFAAAILATAVGFGHARAEGPPGTCDCAVTAVAAAPVAVAPTAPPLPRWGLGLHVASVAVQERTMDEPAEFGGGGLQLRYRVRPRWQLELALAHVTSPPEAAADGVERHLDTAMLSVLYHPRPHARWDWYLIAGLGARADGDPDLDDEAREASQAPTAQLGLGVERRLWGALRKVGISAQATAVAVGQPAEMDAARAAEVDEDVKVDGGFAIGATYYF